MRAIAALRPAAARADGPADGVEVAREGAVYEI
jgi:hypothetical protein